MRGLQGVVTRVNRKGETMLTLCSTAKQPPFTAVEGVDSLYYCRLRPRPVHALDGECRLLAGAQRLDETILGLRFSLHPQSFFQVNAAQAERMYALALDGLELTGAQTALDAYCGAGTITLALAQRCARAVGIEIAPPAVEDARENARVNGLAAKARFCLADAVQEIPRMVKSGERFDAAVLDPPRKGVDERVIQAVVQAAPRRLAYISCDPATLARDLRLLCRSGYALIHVQPVDMFAYTGHVECVALMSRAEK